MSARAEPAVPSLEKEWWLRTLAVFQSPRSVFYALRDDSDKAAEARAEPMLALAFLGGIAAVLATGAAGTLLDGHVYNGIYVVDYDGWLIAVWAVVAGGIYGAATYWIAGGALYLGARAAGSFGSYRRSRHLLGLAAAPLVLWLLFVWPVRLALYGSDLFRTGGDDAGSSRYVFDALGGAFLLWILVLLVVGVRTVHGWSWARSAGAVSFSVVLLLGGGVLAAVS